MDKLKRNLKLAKELIEDQDKFNKDYYYLFRQVYPFTTQNLKEQYNFFDLEGKDVLTVQSSGDQVLELLLNGVKNIDTFDLNPLTEPYFYLKLAAFKSRITKEEYLNFFRYNDYPRFGTKNNKCFNHETFRKIVNNIPGENKEFWINLFLDYNQVKIREADHLFNADEDRERIFEKVLNYYHPEQFKKLYNLVNEFNYNFIETDLRNLPNKLNKKYDLIDLSNIIAYADFMWEDKPLENYRKIIDELVPYLNENGNIIIGYLYQLDTDSRISQCYHKKERDIYFPPNEYQYYTFNSMYDIEYRPQKRHDDAILVYHK